MSEHTKAPWHCTPEPDLPRISVYAGRGDEVVICDVTGEDLTEGGELEANARLIAEAPALYALVRRAVVNRIDDVWLAEARAVLARATGHAPMGGR